MLFVYIIDNPKLTKIGLFESKQSLVVKSRLTQQFTHLIHRYDCAHILQSYCADINIVVDSFVGSLERLILTNLLEQKTAMRVSKRLSSFILFKRSKYKYLSN